MIHLVPAPEKRVRDPKTKKVLGPEGIKIEVMDTYWFRRLRDGEVVDVSAKPAKKEKKEGDK